MNELKSLGTVSVKKNEFKGEIELKNFNEAKEDKNISDFQNSDIFFIEKNKSLTKKIAPKSKMEIIDTRLKIRLRELNIEKKRLSEKLTFLNEIVFSDVKKKHNYEEDLKKVYGDYRVVIGKINELEEYLKLEKECAC